MDNTIVTAYYIGNMQAITFDTNKLSQKSLACLAEAQKLMNDHNEEIKDWITKEKDKLYVLTVSENKEDLHFSKACTDDLKRAAKHNKQTIPEVFKKYAP